MGDPVNVKGYTFISATAPTQNLFEGCTWHDTANKLAMIYTKKINNDLYWRKLKYTIPVYWGVNYGYCMGGYTGSARLSTIDRITFPFDSGTASHVGNLSGTQFSSAGCNSSNYGYSIGGNTGTTIISTIDRIAFPFDSGTASHVGYLSIYRCNSAGIDSTDFNMLFV